MNDDTTALEAAFLAALTPLARVLIAQSMPVAQATELLKRAYLSAALEAEGKAPSDSRVSLQTGLHRKDVKRLRSEYPRPPRRPMLNATALVVAVWSTNRIFLDANGAPKPLLRGGEDGFDALVRAARIDLPPSTVLTSLLEQGLAQQADQAAEITLVRSDLSPSEDQLAKLYAFHKNASAHLEAIADNLQVQTAAHYERGAHFNQLSSASVEKLEQEAARRLHKLLVDLNKMALSLQDQDAPKSEDGRFSVGAYVHTSLPNPENTEDD